MRISTFAATLVYFLLAAAESRTADLSSIDQPIKKEPAYSTGKPKYCLLVFGPEAKTRVWLVQDGDTLYVDRNGNGDLTEAGEKIKRAQADNLERDECTFQVGDIPDGTLVHKALAVDVYKIDPLAESDEQIKALLAKKPDARGYRVSVQLEMPGWKGSGVAGRVDAYTTWTDINGVLQFGETPQSAPILHFGGPWHITQMGQQRIILERQVDIAVGVGTPGRGPGTTTFIGYDGVIPKGLYPTLEIAYVPAQPGADLVRQRLELKERC